MPASKAKPRKVNKSKRDGKAAKTSIVPATSDYIDDALQTELAIIAKRNDNVLAPASVVEAARDPGSVLHDHFEWEDSAAAEAYRIIQARGLIRRVQLSIIREQRKGKVVDVQLTRTRGFESRPSMRNAALGYEPIGDILSNKGKRSELLARALADFAALKRRYERLNELAPLWEALEAIAK